MLTLFALAAAHAHEPGLSRAVVEPDALALSISRADAGAVSPEALLGRTRVSVGGVPCTLGAPTVGPSGDDGVEIRAPLACPAGEAVALDAGWLAQLPPGHRTVIEAVGAPVGFLDALHTTIEVPRAGGHASVGALGFVKLGIEHILTGWDHLAFLAGLLLVAASLKEAAGIATGFTIAHSITLTLAVLGVVTVPASIVEPAIAATIIYVGLENLTAPPARRRLVLTMVLGLVHGLGFAGLLGEIGLPEEGLVLAVLSFNGGVEIGQFLVVLLVLPLLLVLRRDERWRVHGVRVASLLLAGAGAMWLVERVLG
jgi:hypothetical protein